jgi:hypothetical protein
LRTDPSAGVEAVIGFVEILYELPFGVMTPAAILKDNDIAVTNIVFGHFGTRLWCRVARGDVAEVSNIASVGCPFEDDRKPPYDCLATTCRTIHIRRQVHTVSQTDAMITLEHYFEQRRLRAARPTQEAEQQR